MPQLSKDTIDNIATSVINRLRFQFTFSDNNYKLISDVLAAKIEKDIQDKLALINFSAAEIAGLDVNSVVGQLKFTRKRIPYSGGSDDYGAHYGQERYVEEGNIVSGKDIITDGLTKLYYKNLDFKIAKFAIEALSSKKHRTYYPCTKDDNNLSLVTAKAIYLVIKNLHLKTLALSDLLAEMKKLYDFSDPQTQFLRADRGFLYKHTRQYGDTKSWKAAVQAVKDRAIEISQTDRSFANEADAVINYVATKTDAVKNVATSGL